MMNSELQDEASFFAHGKVKFASRDFPSRTAMLSITMPCCLFHAVSPQLLGAGLIDHPKIHDPLSVWMPQLTQDNFSAPAQKIHDASKRVNSAIETRLEESLKIFGGLSGFLKNPSDIIPMLPLGVYVTFQWRCRIDDIMKVLEGIQKLITISGVAEFQWALAGVLHCVLYDYSAWELQMA